MEKIFEEKICSYCNNKCNPYIIRKDCKNFYHIKCYNYKPNKKKIEKEAYTKGVFF